MRRRWQESPGECRAASIENAARQIHEAALRDSALRGDLRELGGEPSPSMGPGHVQGKLSEFFDRGRPAAGLAAGEAIENAGLTVAAARPDFRLRSPYAPAAVLSGESARPVAPPPFGGEGAPAEDLPGRIQKGLRFFRDQQSPLDGKWNARIRTSSVLNNCQLIFLYEALDLSREKRAIVRGLMDYIWLRQDAKGGFPGFPGGTVSDDLSVQAYLAAKIAGEDERSERMLRLERFIRENNSLEGASVAKYYLSLFRLRPTPFLPPGMLYLSLRMGSFLPWPRVILYPFLYLFKSAGTHALDDAKVPYRLGLRTLPVGSRRSPLGTKRFFRWMLGHMNQDATLFDYTLPTIPNLIALAARGDRYADLVFRGVETLEGFLVRDEAGMLHQAFGLDNVGETAAVLWALLDMGLSPRDPMVVRAERFLWGVQQHRTGAFGFTENNQHFPDSDMTGTVFYVLQRLAALRGGGTIEARLRRGMEWLLGLQNQDGGFGTWEREKLPRLSRLLRRFSIPGLVLSESVVEQTARIALALDALRSMSRTTEAAYERAIRFLLARQLPDGSYEGTWFVGRLFSTASTLTALATKLPDPGSRQKVLEAVARGLDYILSRQNDGDGGFSESPESGAPLPGSSPTQTGLVVSQLLRLLEETGDLFRRRLDGPIAWAVGYLLSTQKEDGLWHDAAWTGVAVPGLEYLIYPYLQELAPLHAIGMYHRRSASPPGAR